ncbi:MAG: flagellar assembly protein FliH [Caulobacteraceae bacterium]
MTASPQPFIFETVFDGDQVIEATPRKQLYSAREVELIRAECLLEGERRAHATESGRIATALEDIAATARQALAALQETAHAHRCGSAELAMSAARAIAEAALARFPGAPAQAALEALAREVESSPRLAFRCAPDLVETLQATLSETADRAGVTGKITVAADPAMPAAAFLFDWGAGRAAYDPAAAAKRVSDALNAALAAEGLHAEAVPLTLEAPDV